MIENNIKIPQIIAVVLEAFALVTVFALIQGQDAVLQLFLSFNNGTHVFPFLTVLELSLRFLLFLSCLLTMLYYKGEHRRIVSVIFIAVHILFSIASPYALMINATIAAKSQGAEYFSAYSSLSSAISYCISPMTIVATALFFIACGRYGISETEDTFDPNNYIQP